MQISRDSLRSLALPSRTIFVAAGPGMVTSGSSMRSHCSTALVRTAQLEHGLAADLAGLSNGSLGNVDTALHRQRAGDPAAMAPIKRSGEGRKRRGGPCVDGIFTPAEKAWSPSVY